VVGGLGCGWAKLNVVFSCRQVRWQNTSFNFAKRWNFRPSFLSVCSRVVSFLGLLVTLMVAFVLGLESTNVSFTLNPHNLLKLIILCGLESTEFKIVKEA
jgi:hypothetical protein